MVNMRGARLGSAQWADVYGSLNFGPTTTQLGSPVSMMAAGNAAAVAATPPSEPDRMIAHAFLANPAGVLVLIVGALLVLSLSD